MTVAATYRRISADLDRVPPRAVEKAARLVKRGLDRSGRAATGDGRFSGAPWARLTVEVDVRRLTGDVATAELTPARRAGGPWRWIEDGTTRHIIGRGRNREGHRRRLNIGDGWVAGPVEHRGASGKQAWTRGRESVEVEARRIMRAEFEAALR